MFETRAFGRHAVAQVGALVVHIAGVAGLSWLASVPPPAARPPQPLVVDPASSFLLRPASDDGGGGTGGAGTSAGGRPGLGIGGTAGVAGGRMTLPPVRLDITKIAERAPLLFPFAVPGLDVDGLHVAPRREVDRRFHPFAVAALDPDAVPGRPPLQRSDVELQALVDEAWSRRERWRAFQDIVTLSARHDPDQGLLPVLLHEYIRQNTLQPYSDGATRDPRFWTQLRLAADHLDYIAFISGYAIAHPLTKTTTELLFLLDRLAEASLDALVGLLGTDPVRDLELTRAASPDAYDLAERLRSFYRTQLEQKGVFTTDDLRRLYDAQRVALLEEALRQGPAGYRASDARFLIGAIHWRQGYTQAALTEWQELRVDATDKYVAAYADILLAMESADERALAARIDAILDEENGRWIEFSYDRLRTFGYRFSTY